MKNFACLFSLVFMLTSFSVQPINAQFGSLGKWFRNEALPTIKGDRPLNIDPSRVTINHGGGGIFEATSKGEGTLYIDMGVAKLQTGKLTTRLAQTSAIFSGNTAIMSQVAYEQLQKQLEREGNKLIQGMGVTTSPPLANTPDYGNESREVVIWNSTGVTVKYLMNDKFFELPHNSGYKHTGSDFYFEYHSDPSDEAKIVRLSIRNSDTVGLFSRDGRTIDYMPLTF